MSRARVIPVLSIYQGKMVKTCRFADPLYLGDPLNILRIFNSKKVDEICVIDMGASQAGQGPAFKAIGEMVAECFMPLCYGGGVRNLEDMERIFGMGVEKISINRQLGDASLVERAAARFGSQSIVASIDVMCREDGVRQVYDHVAKHMTGKSPEVWAQHCESLGCGEILLNSVQREGMLCGYDLDLISAVASGVSVPVIACGGARSVDDLAAALAAGASAAGAGSMFSLYGRHKAVLIRYPEEEQITQLGARAQ